MRSHSVNYHLAEVTFHLCPSQLKLLLDLATLEGLLNLDLVGWLDTKVLYPPKDGNPSQY